MEKSAHPRQRRFHGCSHDETDFAATSSRTSELGNNRSDRVALIATIEGRWKSERGGEHRSEKYQMTPETNELPIRDDTVKLHLHCNEMIEL